MQGKKESTRVQIRKDGKKIADITIPYAWKESDWPDALTVSYTHLTLPTNREV